jgi:hypothetical protein
MSEKKSRFSFKKLFFMKSFFGSLVGKVELTDRRLNWLSILFLIAFDVFIFINLSDGLANQRDNITSPYYKYSYECRNLFNLNSNLNYDNFRTINNSNGSNYIRKDINAPFYDKNFVRDDASEYCKSIIEEVSKIKTNSEFKTLFKKLESYNSSLNSLESQKYNYENQYDEFREDYKA